MVETGRGGWFGRHIFSVCTGAGVVGGGCTGWLLSMRLTEMGSSIMLGALTGFLAGFLVAMYLCE